MMDKSASKAEFVDDMFDTHWDDQNFDLASNPNSKQRQLYQHAHQSGKMEIQKIKKQINNMQAFLKQGLARGTVFIQLQIYVI